MKAAKPGTFPFFDKLKPMSRPTSAIVFAAALAAAALCLYGSKTPPRAKPEPPESAQSITDQILRLEDLLDDAESHHRVATVAELIADDYSGVTIGGGVIAKRDVLAAVGGKEETSSQSQDRQVRALGNAAVYTALVLDHGIDQKTAQPYVLATRVMDIWQKRGRDWKLVNDQATPVSLDPAAQ